MLLNRLAFLRIARGRSARRPARGQDDKKTMRRGERAGEDWTAAAVAEAAIEAFRTLPNIPIYSPRRAELVPANPRHDGAGIDVIGWSERILGHASPERRALLVWARAMARRRIRQDRHLRLVRSVPGGSVSDHCREAGLCRRTFDRQRVRACARIAAELNRVGREDVEVDLRTVIGVDGDWRATVSSQGMRIGAVLAGTSLSSELDSCREPVRT